MRIAVLLAAFMVAPAFAAGAPDQWRLVKVEGGGFAIERGGVEPVAAAGIATIKEIVPLLTEQAAAEKVDYSNGVKFDGVFSVMIGREDGTLGKYEGASDIIAFAAPETMKTISGVTTLDGAIVFALKIDNRPRAVQRFERGVITLTQTKKSI